MSFGLDRDTPWWLLAGNTAMIVGLFVGYALGGYIYALAVLFASVGIIGLVGFVQVYVNKVRRQRTSEPEGGEGQ